METYDETNVGILIPLGHLPPRNPKSPSSPYSTLTKTSITLTLITLTVTLDSNPVSDGQILLAFWIYIAI